MDAPIRIEHLDHHFGRARLRRQILFDVTATIHPGEIVILTGPSGSGKTTALTLVGALRSAQRGSLQVLGVQLVGSSTRARVRLRRQIGYIFQHHNLLDALTARQNVQTALELHPEKRGRERRRHAAAMLEAVGLGDLLGAHPDQLSGGQKQRVAIARALASDPRLILADEPTASLDRQSGREVVTLMQGLARGRGVPVVLVTHDNRILDVADRILHLEDGRLKSFGDAVLANTRHLLGVFADFNRKGELARRVGDMHPEEFGDVLERVTREAEQFMEISELSQGQAFESMLDAMLEAFTRKIGDILEADRASVFLLDPARNELWSKGARGRSDEPVEIRISRGVGVAGAVAASGEPLNLADAHDDPRFDASADRRTGYRTRSLLCIPLRAADGSVFAVAQALNKRGRDRFDSDDQKRFEDFMASLGVLLESWWRMTEQRRSRAGG
jgi:putative ABC transport system ATP-binding protein